MIKMTCIPQFQQTTSALQFTPYNVWWPYTTSFTTWSRVPNTQQGFWLGSQATKATRIIVPWVQRLLPEKLKTVFGNAKELATSPFITFDQKSSFFSAYLTQSPQAFCCSIGQWHATFAKEVGGSELPHLLRPIFQLLGQRQDVIATASAMLLILDIAAHGCMQGESIGK